MYSAAEALGFVETLLAQLGDQQIEAKGSEVGAYLAMVKALIDKARAGIKTLDKG